MSRQRRAAPSISAAAATAARRSSSQTRRSPLPGVPRIASAPTVTPSSVRAAQAAATVGLGQRQSQPAELGHVLPHRLALTARVVPQPAHDGRGAPLVEERARRILQELLVAAEREVHHFTRSARVSLGRPSTRSPITFFWISDEPE